MTQPEEYRVPESATPEQVEAFEAMRDLHYALVLSGMEPELAFGMVLGLASTPAQVFDREDWSL